MLPTLNKSKQTFKPNQMTQIQKKSQRSWYYDRAYFYFMYAYLYVYYWYTVAYNYLQKMSGNRVSMQVESLMDVEDRYVLLRKNEFINESSKIDSDVLTRSIMITKGGGIGGKSPAPKGEWAESVGSLNANANANSNIQTLMYDKELHTAYFTSDVPTEMELQWRRCIMFESTPRGNVVMYYDPFKMGFAYYSDQHMPYKLLNACAAKYVKTFRCCDFFMDESWYSVGHVNKMMVEHQKQTQTQTQTLDDTATISDTNTPAKIDVPKIDVHNGPFLRPKQNRAQTQTQTQTQNKTQTQTAQKNKFIYIGKITGIQLMTLSTITNTNNTKKSVTNFTSSLLEGLEQNSNAQSNRVSYGDYKKMQQQQQQQT